MRFSAGSIIARASSGSRSRNSSVESLMSANSAVTVLRSPSVSSGASGGAEVKRISVLVGVICVETRAAGAPLGSSGLPQSSQNADDDVFSAPHLGQRFVSGLPQEAQNFRPVVLSVPHFVHRIALPLRGTWPLVSLIGRKQRQSAAPTEEQQKHTVHARRQLARQPRFHSL